MASPRENCRDAPGRLRFHSGSLRLWHGDDVVMPLWKSGSEPAYAPIQCAQSVQLIPIHRSFSRSVSPGTHRSRLLLALGLDPAHTGSPTQAHNRAPEGGYASIFQAQDNPEKFSAPRHHARQLQIAAVNVAGVIFWRTNFICLIRRRCIG